MLECPVKYALNILNGKWKMQIIWEMNQQEYIRFNDLQRKLEGISSVMLSKKLKELQDFKIINRFQYNEVPPHVEYQLTELGKAILPSLINLGDWGKLVYQENEKLQ